MRLWRLFLFWLQAKDKRLLAHLVYIFARSNFDGRAMSNWVRSAAKRAMVWSVGVIMLLCMVAVADKLLFSNTLSQHFGIRPRDFSAWYNVLLAPLLHKPGDLNSHLLGNLVRLISFGVVLLAWGWRELWITAAFGVLGAGVATLWYGTPGTTVVGASGVWYALFGYLVARGFITRNWQMFSIGFLALFLASKDVVMGLQSDGVTSIESHAGGIIGGLLASVFIWQRK